MNYDPFKKKKDGSYSTALDRFQGGYKPENLVDMAEATKQKEPDYATMSKEYMDQYLKRKPFEFDVNADMLYQQYRKQAAESGRIAMEDTMARAAAMTGGYASSYAQAAGQQAYQKYLDAADAMIPELYQLARSRYDAEGQDLLNKASAAASMLPGATKTEGMSVSDAMLLLGSDPRFTEGTTDYQNALYQLVYGGVSDDFVNDKFDSEFGEDGTSEWNGNISELKPSQFTKKTDGGGTSFAGKLNDNAMVMVPDGNIYTIAELYEKLLEEGKTKQEAKKFLQQVQRTLGLED